MGNMIKSGWFILLALLVACSKINKTNFDQIKPGMTKAQVVSILGPSTSTTSLAIGEVVGTTATWSNRNGEITILFFNGKVNVKRYVEGVTTPRKG